MRPQLYINSIVLGIIAALIILLVVFGVYEQFRYRRRLSEEFTFPRSAV